MADDEMKFNGIPVWPGNINFSEATWGGPDLLDAMIETYYRDLKREPRKPVRIVSPWQEGLSIEDWRKHTKDLHHKWQFDFEENILKEPKRIVNLPMRAGKSEFYRTQMSLLEMMKKFVRGSNRRPTIKQHQGYQKWILKKLRKP